MPPGIFAMSAKGNVFWLPDSILLACLPDRIRDQWLVSFCTPLALKQVASGYSGATASVFHRLPFAFHTYSNSQGTNMAGSVS